MTENMLPNMILNTNGKVQSLEIYVTRGGFTALKRALEEPESIISVLDKTGLKGRSGSGFPVGLKWKTTLEAPEEDKYIVCNADEGEPGTNKDRKILLYNPLSVIEGMAIAALAVKAEHGLIYLRAEYSYLLPVLKRAIREAEQAGYLGENILGFGRRFQIEVHSGAGAYICGEETALLESLEGHRGETRLKPPYPGVSGYMGKPTVINNVETFACVTAVMRDGVDKYRKYGTNKNPGTKLITLSGCIKNPGVYEIPMGMKIRAIYEQLGGGCEEGKHLYAIQTGGQSGPIATPEILDTAFDIEGCTRAGAFFGTGALMFIPMEISFLDFMHNVMEFFRDESCGKCIPCRLGSEKITAILEKLCKKEGTDEDLQELKRVAEHMRDSSRCALGKAAATPLLSSMQNFSEAYDVGVHKSAV